MTCSSVKSNRYHNKAVQESKRAFCYTAAASRTFPILKLTQQFKSIASVICSFLPSHILAQEGHMHTLITPKIPHKKPTSRDSCGRSITVLPLFISFLPHQHVFGSGKSVLLHFICFATLTQKILRSGLRS